MGKGEKLKERGEKEGRHRGRKNLGHLVNIDFSLGIFSTKEKF